jgi:hypothetical protein
VARQLGLGRHVAERLTEELAHTHTDISSRKTASMPS